MQHMYIQQAVACIMHTAFHTYWQFSIGNSPTEVRGNPYGHRENILHRIEYKSNSIAGLKLYFCSKIEYLMSANCQLFVAQ